ncbi:MAG TPA: hypothetical protein PKH31_13720, partial [Candidatus Sumerlaeota bacterium]|nr:hypothetical protein [Candidatus Sumerlaeota bacterium]
WIFPVWFPPEAQPRNRWGAFFPLSRIGNVFFSKQAGISRSGWLGVFAFIPGKEGCASSGNVAENKR